MRTVVNWNIAFLLRVIKKNLLQIVIVSAVISGLVVVGASLLRQPTYTSQVQISQNDNNVAEITSYVQFVNTDKFQQLLRQKVKKSKWKNTAEKYDVKITTADNSAFFHISATAQNAEFAQFLAREATSVFSDNVSKYLAGANITIVANASVPNGSDTISFEKVGISAFGVIVLVLFVIAFYREIHTKVVIDKHFLAEVYGYPFLGNLEIIKAHES